MHVARPPLTVTALARPPGSGVPLSVNATTVTAAVSELPAGSDTAAMKVTFWPWTAVVGIAASGGVASGLAARMLRGDVGQARIGIPPVEFVAARSSQIAFP